MIQIGNVNAQDKKLEKADEAFSRFSFVEAGKLYEKLVSEGNTSVGVFTNLGDCYYFNANYAKAADSYSKVIGSQMSIDPEYYFRYAQALNNSQKYDEAARIMKIYYQKADKKDLSQNWTEAKLMQDIKKQSGRYALKTIAVNTPFSDFGTGFYGKDKVVYASARDTGVIIKRKHTWNEKPFLKLYTANIDVDGGLSSPTLVKGDINTRYHQSSPAITKDGETMYFTRSNFKDGELGTDKEGTSYLKIYVAKNVKGEWKNVTELPYPVNSDGFSSAHPALSPDETELYFVSDRNNKFGNSDLYVIGLNKNGTIVNNLKKLGDEINTPGRETYPFLDDNGILYFSSDGHPGLGGLDVFAAVKDREGMYHVVNLGDQVNTTNDDFAYVIQELKSGYFSSNRTGNDDLYGFTEEKPIQFDFDIQASIFGLVSNVSAHKPIADVAVEVYNNAKVKVAEAKTNKEGNYKVAVDPFQSYTLIFKKAQLMEKSAFVSKLKAFEEKELNIDLFDEMNVVVDGEVKTIIEGNDLTKILNLKPIYFDFNGYNIRESSKAELDKVVAVMKDHPHISVAVNSHTDSRGKNDFNMRLSQNRARATVNYIIKAGISKSRVTGKGFGETRLVNGCTDGVPCSEEEHQENRRSEFIVNLK